ncbi:MAG: hypothetical protein AAGA48_34975 [Myxococcota bacterium]
MSIESIIDDFRGEIPGFVSTDIVHIESGMSIGGGSVDPNFDASVASASYAEVVKTNKRALELLGLDPHSTEDILITTDQVYLLIRMLGTDYYHGLAIARSGNLGLCRAIIKKYATRFLDEIANLS